MKEILLATYKWIPKGLCLITFFNTSREHILWYLDSVFSRHMTKDPTILFGFMAQEGGIVTFGVNGNGKILSKGCVGETSTIENIYLVNDLKHNLLNIS